ncbi:hypothetical protein [Nocardia transvalensis]|uniref:hypothetical protein n=1 Tax=Nocardia transvalensis TaxID=37333 RepID=UPI00189329CC|nr:hypothetical protein [Nocardia transvalensis]MBF6333886.1 hypothetical protein [Nocardia transvalensis]
MVVPVHQRLEFDVDLEAAADPDEAVVLRLSQALPDVCSTHGRSAVERRTNDIRFRRTRKGWRQRTVGGDLRFLLVGMLRAAAQMRRLDEGAETLLEGEWPVCSKCLRNYRWFNGIGHTIVVAGFVLMFLLFATWSMGYRIVALGVAFFPGWLPIGLFGAMFAYTRARTFLRVKQIVDRTAVVIRAHPDFAAAVPQMALSDGSKPHGSARERFLDRLLRRHPAPEPGGAVEL